MRRRLLKRGLFAVNIVLALVALALAYSFFTAIQPASARILERPMSELDEELAALEARYMKQRRKVLAWEPPAPVSEAELRQHILREEYARNHPRHWIFSGPMYVPGMRISPRPGKQESRGLKLPR